MAPGTAKRPIARKRNRKRKRRNLSSSSSSSSELSPSSSSNSENEKEAEPTTVKLPQKLPQPTAVATKAANLSSKQEEQSSSSESEATSSSESKSEMEYELGTTTALHKDTTQIASRASASRADETTVRQQPHSHKPRVPSPLPIQNVPVPNILDGDKEKEEALRARFRQFWLGCVADAFADDLNEIRKEPNLTPARLSLLIDSLAAGANVYDGSEGSNVSPSPDGKRVNEIEVVLGSSD